MIHAVRLTRDNRHIIFSELNITVEDIEKDMIQAKLDFPKQQNKIWIIQKLKKDSVWLEQTLKKVHKIRCSLSKDMDYKEKTIKMYGWVANQFPKMELSMPLQERSEYTRADCMELILTNPSMYRKIQNWD